MTTKKFICPCCKSLSYRLYKDIHSNIKKIPEGLTRPLNASQKIFNCLKCNLKFTNSFFLDSVEKIYTEDKLYSSSLTYNISKKYPKYSNDILSFKKIEKKK